MRKTAIVARDGCCDRAAYAATAQRKCARCVVTNREGYTLAADISAAAICLTGYRTCLIAIRALRNKRRRYGPGL